MKTKYVRIAFAKAIKNIPKGTDFTTVTKAEIRRVQNQLNNRPRKVLEYYKPD